jgi:hypothetical protein
MPVSRSREIHSKLLEVFRIFAINPSDRSSMSCIPSSIATLPYSLKVPVFSPKSP